MKLNFLHKEILRKKMLFFPSGMISWSCLLSLMEGRVADTSLRYYFSLFWTQWWFGWITFLSILFWGNWDSFSFLFLLINGWFHLSFLSSFDLLSQIEKKRGGLSNCVVYVLNNIEILILKYLSIFFGENICQFLFAQFIILYSNIHLLNLN